MSKTKRTAYPDNYASRHQPKKPFIAFNMSYKCFKCGQERFGTAGSTFVQVGRYKKRLCPVCVAKRKQTCENNPVAPNQERK